MMSESTCYNKNSFTELQKQSLSAYIYNLHPKGHVCKTKLHFMYGEYILWLMYTLTLKIDFVYRLIIALT